MMATVEIKLLKLNHNYSLKHLSWEKKTWHFLLTGWNENVVILQLGFKHILKYALNMWLLWQYWAVGARGMMGYGVHGWLVSWTLEIFLEVEHSSGILDLLQTVQLFARGIMCTTFW